MFSQTILLLGAAGALSFAGPVAAQDPVVRPPAPAPLSVPAPPASPTFPSGAEVLSVDGDPLGVLAEVEARPGGERILHIRRTDGSMTQAPASVASRGERAVVLDWTRAEFEEAATAPPVSASASPIPPLT